MKRILLVGMTLATLLMLAVATASAYVPTGEELAYVDLSNAVLVGDRVNGTYGHCYSFTAQGWGGEYDHGAVTAMPGTSENPEGYCSFYWPTRSRARRLELSILDSALLDDSFEIYAQNNGGKPVLLYSYTDQNPTTDTWVPVTITRVPQLKGESKVELTIKPLTIDYGGINRGQLCVDYVALFSTRN
jgi:hypothetical protein